MVWRRHPPSRGQSHLKTRRTNSSYPLSIQMILTISPSPLKANSNPWENKWTEWKPSKVNHHDLPAMDHHLSNLQRLIGQRPIDQSPIEVLTHLEMISTSVKELSNNPRTILSDAEQISGDCGTLCPATSRHILLRWKRISASAPLRSHRDNL
jgi:hypothetical protein